MIQVSIKKGGARWYQDREGAWLCLRVQSPASAMSVCDEVNPDKEYTLQLKGKGRSLDANRYMWELINQLSAKVRVPPNELYREYIKDVGGNCEIVPVREDRIAAWDRVWCAGHIGRLTEDMGPCRNIPGYHNVKSYISSSDYDAAQMSRLIDLVVFDCKAQGIETMTPWQLDALKSRWGAAQPMGGGA